MAEQYGPRQIPALSEGYQTVTHPGNWPALVLNYSSLTLWYIYPIFYFHSAAADVDCY